MSVSHWQEWELRYEHDRDFQAAQCQANDEPVPVEERYGALKRAPQRIWRRFNGQRFWPAFERLGHTKAVFEQCQCRLRQGTEKKTKEA